MKTTKFLSLAALALTFAACSNNNDIDLAQQPAEANGEITITATIASNDGAKTRVLSESGTGIASTWAVGEKIAILFDYNTEKTMREAEVKSVDAGIATITFSIPADLTGSQVATLVYPSTAVNSTNDGADVDAALAKQDGTLGHCPEVRTGSGTLNADAKTLTVASALVTQNAIFKITVQNSSSEALNVKPLIATIGSKHYTINPASATSELWVALPAVASKTVGFVASGYTFSKNVTLAAGTYYQSTLKMTAANTVNLASQGSAYEAQNGEILTGTLGANVKISIADGAVVTLDGVTINGTNNESYQFAGINCKGDAIIILKDGSTNNVKGFHRHYPGINAALGKTLTILGTGSLTASPFDGGGYYSIASAAGIGGDYIYGCGNIVIEDGNITATGGNAAGIGSPQQSSNCGDITISGGTIIATGGLKAAGIGSGLNSICGNITISGGNIDATGGDSGAGIGSGYAAGGNTCSCGAITITTGVTKVKATKGAGTGSGAPQHSIGAGGNGATCGTVTIGGVVGAISTSPYTYQP